MKNRIGTVVWNELQTKEVDIMKRLNSAIFGYKWSELPIDENISYHIGMVNDVNALGVVQLPPIVEQSGGQPFNIYYIAVENLERLKEKAVSLGGKIIIDEIAMENIGRWSIMLDPFGAAFCLMEMQGTPVPMEERQQGHYWWHEVVAKNAKASAIFYGKLLNWKIEEVQIDNQLYYLAKNSNDENVRVGFSQMDERLKAANINDFWLGFVYVDDVNDICQKVENNGATILLGPISVDAIGLYAWLSQPDNSIIGIVTPN